MTAETAETAAAASGSRPRPARRRCGGWSPRRRRSRARQLLRNGEQLTLTLVIPLLLLAAFSLEPLVSFGGGYTRIDFLTPGRDRARGHVHRVHQPGDRHRLRAQVRGAQAARRHAAVPDRADRRQDHHRHRRRAAAGGDHRRGRPGARLVAGRAPGGHRRRPAPGPARHRRVQRLRPAAGRHAAGRGDAGRGEPDLRRAARRRRRGVPADQVPGRRPPAARAAAHRGAVHRAARRARQRRRLPGQGRADARGLGGGRASPWPPASSGGSKEPVLGDAAVVPRPAGFAWFSPGRSPCRRAPGSRAGCSARSPRRR